MFWGYTMENVLCQISIHTMEKVHKVNESRCHTPLSVQMSYTTVSPDVIQHCHPDVIHHGQSRCHTPLSVQMSYTTVSPDVIHHCQSRCHTPLSVQMSYTTVSPDVIHHCQSRCHTPLSELYRILTPNTICLSIYSIPEFQTFCLLTNFTLSCSQTFYFATAELTETDYIPQYITAVFFNVRNLCSALYVKIVWSLQCHIFTLQLLSSKLLGLKVYFTVISSTVTTNTHICDTWSDYWFQLKEPSSGLWQKTMKIIALNQTVTKASVLLKYNAMYLGESYWHFDSS
jgi:hypothetical protein